MTIIDYQDKYLAQEVTKRCPSDSVQRLAAAVARAHVDVIEGKSESTSEEALEEFTDDSEPEDEV